MCHAHLPSRHAGPSAVSFVSRLRGGSRPVILLTTGVKLYVTKFRTLTGHCGLLGEAVGAGILSAMGLPVPEWTPVMITDQFLDAHPEMWGQRSEGDSGIRPKAGLHFGSRLMISDDGTEPYQIIPTSWIPRVTNGKDFVGALLADLWMNNCDRRQTVYVKDGSADRLRAVFIDNDNAFGGYQGNEETSPRRAMVPCARFYDGVWTKDNLAYWRSRLNRVDETCLDAIFAAVPEEWADADCVCRARSQLLRRRLMLDSLVAAAEEELGRNGLPVASSPYSAVAQEQGSPLAKKPSRSVYIESALAHTVA